MKKSPTKSPPKYKNPDHGILSGESIQCATCNTKKSIMEMVPSHSPFFPSGRTTLCYSCVESIVDGNDLNQVDRLCQFANIAFLPDEWRKMWKQHEIKAFKRYCESYYSINYYKFDWAEQNEHLMDLAKKGTVDLELDELRPALMEKLRIRWGEMPERDLLLLEELFNTSMDDYAIYTGQEKQMLGKICRLSLMIDNDFMNNVVDKDKISQYDRLLTSLQKVVEKNETDGITTAADIASFIERNGYVANFYDGLPRDDYDRIIQNIHEHNRDLVLSAVNITDKYESRKRQIENRRLGKEEIEELEEFAEDTFEELDNELDQEGEDGEYGEEQ